MAADAGDGDQSFWTQAWQGFKELPPWAKLTGFICLLAAFVLFAAWMAHSDQAYLMFSFVGLIVLFLVASVILAYMYRPVVDQSIPAVERTRSCYETGTLKLARSLTPAQRVRILRLLEEATTQIANLFDLSGLAVRSNLFGRDANECARIIPGLHFNMNVPSEMALALKPREGSTGMAFEAGRGDRGNWVTYRDDWRGGALSPEQQAFVHPNLRWVLSWPLYTDGAVKWVLNVDGIDGDPSDDALGKGVAHLKPLAASVGWELADLVAVIATTAAD